MYLLIFEWKKKPFDEEAGVLGTYYAMRQAWITLTANSNVLWSTWLFRIANVVNILLDSFIQVNRTHTCPRLYICVSSYLYGIRDPVFGFIPAKYSDLSHLLTLFQGYSG